MKCCFVTGSQVGRSAVVPWGVKGLEVQFRHRWSSGLVSGGAVGSQRT